MDTALLELVVEDEALIQDWVETALLEAGFQVAKATSAEEAITLLEKDGSEYRALVTDINLAPGKLMGWDAARRGGELTPEFPVVYMTGESEHQWASEGVPNSVMIAKPFAPVQIVTAVSNLLNAAASKP